MKREVVETCPWCEAENVMEWNIENDGYVAYCPHCGNKMMLCDECMHSDDNECMHCDWCEDCDGGVCFRDTRPVIIETYNDDSVDTVKCFSVPRNWLKKHIKDETIDNFLHNYTWDEAMQIFDAAKADGVVKENV